MHCKRLGPQIQRSYLATHFSHVLLIFLVFARSSKSLSQLTIIVLFFFYQWSQEPDFLPKVPPNTHIGLQHQAFRSPMLKGWRLNFRSNVHLKNNSCAQIPQGFVSTASANYMFCLHGKWTIQIMVWQFSMCGRSQGVYCGDKVGNSAGNLVRLRMRMAKKTSVPGTYHVKEPSFKREKHREAGQTREQRAQVCFLEN